MTFDTAKTELEGYPVQYESKAIQHLNQLYSVARFSNLLIEKIGEKFSPKGRHFMYVRTEDGYAWFGGLEFEVDTAKVAVLFPFAQDWNNPKTLMDRSINVYSNRKLPAKTVEDLVEQVAYQTVLTIRANQ